MIKSKIKTVINNIKETLKTVVCILLAPIMSSRRGAARFLYRIALAASSLASDEREPCSSGHIRRTAEIACAVACEAVRLGYFTDIIDSEFIEALRDAVPLHDIGKIAIPRSILATPGGLSEEEFEIVKTHTTVGRAIIENFANKIGGCKYLEFAAEIAGCHHERWDGTGYPSGLAGEDIPLCARIMAVADVYDAIRSRRPYKPAYTKEKAIDIIENKSEGHFDPRLREALLSAIKNGTIDADKTK